MLDFPQPLGPTTAVMPPGKTSFWGSAKDLNPCSSRAMRRKPCLRREPRLPFNPFLRRAVGPWERPARGDRLSFSPIRSFRDPPYPTYPLGPPRGVPGRLWPVTMAFKSKQAGILWIEPHRLVAGGRTRPLSGLPGGDEVGLGLGDLPVGPSSWVVEDLWAPAALLRDVVDLPLGTEAREAFFRWKFTQALALEGPYVVQSLAMDEGTWLLAGLPEGIRDAWLQAAIRAGRPVFSLVPRWLWLYNRLAPRMDLPGMLLSLCPHPAGGFTGSLAAWGRSLVLLRQWADPATPEQWMEERVGPTSAYLQRDARTPQGLWVWGAQAWPSGECPVHLLPPEIPAQEAL